MKRAVAPPGECPCPRLARQRPEAVLSERKAASGLAHKASRKRGWGTKLLAGSKPSRCAGRAKKIQLYKSVFVTRHVELCEPYKKEAPKALPFRKAADRGAGDGGGRSRRASKRPTTPAVARSSR